MSKWKDFFRKHNNSEQKQSNSEQITPVPGQIPVDTPSAGGRNLTGENFKEVDDVAAKGRAKPLNAGRGAAVHAGDRFGPSDSSGGRSLTDKYKATIRDERIDNAGENKENTENTTPKNNKP